VYDFTEVSKTGGELLRMSTAGANMQAEGVPSDMGVTLFSDLGLIDVPLAFITFALHG
jgi:hypothetical protein